MNEPIRRATQSTQVIVRNGRDEMNLAELPFATLRRQGDTRRVIEYRWWTSDPAGNRQERVWIASPSAKPGMPNEFAERVYVALMAVSASQKFESRKVPFSPRQLLMAMGLGAGKKDYENLVNALDRLTGVTFYSQNAFWDNQGKQTVTTSEAFHLIDNYWLRYREKDEKVKTQRREPAYIFWNEMIWNSFKAGYIKSLDLRFFNSLKTPLARRLYRLLDKRLYQKKEYVFDIFDLAGKLGMVRYGKPVWIQRKLQPAIDELIAKGFLTHAEFFKVDRYARVRFVKVLQLTAQRLTELWQKTLLQLQQQLSRSTFQMWLARTTLVKIEEGIATVGVPNAMSQEWIAAQFADILQRLLKDVSGLSISELRFEITSAKASE